MIIQIILIFKYLNNENNKRLVKFSKLKKIIKLLSQIRN